MDKSAKIIRAIKNEDLSFLENNSHLLRTPEQITSLTYAIRNGRFPVIKLLLELGYPIKSNRNNRESKILTEFVETYDRPDILLIMDKHNLNLSFYNHKLLVYATKYQNYGNTQFLLNRINTSDLLATTEGLKALFEHIKTQKDLEELSPLINQFKDKLTVEKFNDVITESFINKKDLLVHFMYKKMDESIPLKEDSTSKRLKI